MSSVNYIAVQQSDRVENGGTFIPPSSYGTKFDSDQNSTYIFLKDIDGKTASDIGYTPGSEYEAWFLAKYPNAPNGIFAEVINVRNSIGPSGSAWWDGVI